MDWEKVEGVHKIVLMYEKPPTMYVKYEGAFNPYSDALKTQVITGTIGKRHREAELDALKTRGIEHELPTPRFRLWGTRIGKSPVIEHKGKKYLEVTEVVELLTVYTDRLMRRIPNEAIKPWLNTKGEIVHTRLFNLDEIVRATIDNG